MIKLLKCSALLALTMSTCVSYALAAPSENLTNKMKSLGVIHNHQVIEGGLTAWTIGSKSGKVAVFYTTPDEKVMIKGDLWRILDRKNLSDNINIGALNFAAPDFKNRVLTSIKKNKIESTAKPVIVKNNDLHSSAEIVGNYKGATPQIITILHESAGYKEGTGSPIDTLYIYYDPRCKWCHEVFYKTRPYVKKGFSIKWLPTLARGKSENGYAMAASILQKPNQNTLENSFKRDSKYQVQATEKSRKDIDLNLENLLALVAGFDGDGAQVSVPTGFYLNKKTGKVKKVEGLADDIYLDQVFGK